MRSQGRAIKLVNGAKGARFICPARLIKWDGLFSSPPRTLLTFSLPASRRLILPGDPAHAPPSVAG